MQESATPCFGLNQAVIDKISAVFAQYPQVAEVRLYGSRAKGNFHNGSDIDLTIIGDDVSNQQLLRMESDIEDLLLPYSVDLSLFRQIDNSELIGHIERIGKTFYSAKAART